MGISSRIGIFFLFLYVHIAWAVPEPIRPKLVESARPGSPEAVLLTGTSEFLTDNAIADRKAQRTFRIYGRETEADSVLDTLVRLKGAVPILTGDAGVGKTTAVTRAVQKSLLKKFPKDEAYKEILTDSVWISTTPARLMKLADGNGPADRMGAIEAYFDAVLALEKKYQRKFIIFIDEIHSLDKHQVEAMLPYLDSRDKGIRLVGATNSDKFQLAFKENEAFLRRINLVGVEEMSEQLTLEVMRQWWIPEIEKHYSVKFGEQVPEAVVRIAPTLLPEAGRFDASIKTLQDIAIRTVRARGGAENPVDIDPDAPAEPAAEGVPATTIEVKQVYDFFTKRTGYPVNPYDSQAMLAYIEELRAKVSEDIIDQPRMVQDVLRLYQSVMIGSKKGLGVSLLVGPTGSGKSELGLVLAKHGFKNPDAFLRIDANEYKTGGHSMNKLFGAEGGLVTSNTRAGILCDFFDDPAKGKYGGVILIDEGERAHPDFWERLMEFFDTGAFVGGDGKRRFARKHLVVITSNRGDKILFPERASLWSENELNSRTGQITQKEIKDLFLRRISGGDEFSVPVPVLNRIDTYSVSRPITKETSKKIIAKVLREFVEETSAQFEVKFEIDPAVGEFLGQLDFNLRDGARPIIQKCKQIIQDARTQALAQLGLSRGTTVRLTLDGGAGVPSALIIHHDERTVAVGLPAARVEDPLADPEMREKLRTFRPKLEKRIIGQPQAIESVSRATIAHVGSPLKSKRPLSFFLIGLTGVGKTEMGKSIADTLYGSADRVEVIPLGHITHESQFTKVFGSDPGYIGSDKERSFEDALRNNPEGGVIIWDEASNLGGKDAALKETFFKKFYDLLDEGTWTSGATGHTYDLSKYVFLFTGNDGETLFRGISTDELSLHTWQNNNSRERVRQILLESGVPQAFIGRMADTLLMKPLLRSEVNAIAKIQLERALEPFRQRGIHVEIDDAFLKSYADAFFTPDTGARSLRSVAESRIRGVLTETLVNTEWQPGEEGQKSIRLKLDYERPVRPYRKPGEGPATVPLRVEILRGGQVAETHPYDLTEHADLPDLLSQKQAIMTAYHEAGHAVVNDPGLTGQRLGHVTIRTGKGYLGYAHYEEVKGQEQRVMNREVAVARISRLLGGQMAMVMAGYPPDSGWSSDLEKARRIATKMVLDYGLAPGLAALPLGDKNKIELTDGQRELVAQEVDRLIQEGRVQAQERLNAQWPLVRKVVNGLMKTGLITAQEFESWEKERVAVRRTPKNPLCTGLFERIGEAG